ncbi:MAG TPA: TetR/AcrR family transcriptional regulator [Bacteroidales bacterium]|nr:TetR/AcrR family transcriptional regulator [Bacteroidales bacterium]
MGHIERRIREKERIRKRIIESALNIATKKGWEAVTIRKIADAIEYTPPIVYEHFKNKEDLFNELVLLGHRRLTDSAILAIGNETDSRKILMIFSMKFWDFAFENKELYQLMFSLNSKIPDKEVISLIQKFHAIFTELVGDEKIAPEAMFSYMCLQQGYIYNVKQMGLPPGFEGKDPKKLFKKAISKYIRDI